jgi:hypothetical protein
MTLTHQTLRTTPAPEPNHYCLGLDLGRQADPSALALLRWHLPWPPPRGAAIKPPVYEVPTLKRWPLGTPYLEIARAVAAFINTPPLCEHRPVLIVDATGVGDAVYEMVRHEMVKNSARGGIAAVVITAGSAVTQDPNAPGRWRVAKKQLASILQVLLGTRRLQVAAGLPEARTLQDELSKFTVKITDAGNETFEAWRENDHDDLVLAVALAAWAAETLHNVFYPPPQRPLPRYVYV